MERAKLRAARLRKHWSVREAAEHLGVDSDTLFSWELGKTRPRGYNIQKLIDVYEMSAEELGLAPPEHPSARASQEPEPQSRPVPAFVKNNLTMRLLALGFINLSFPQVQAQMTRILEDDTGMTHDLISRRVALRSLTTALFLTYLNPSSALTLQLNDDLLRQTAACIAACWELSRSKEREDITTAFESASAYAQTLKALIREAVSSQQRQDTASLIAQCEILLTILSWHFINLGTAARHAKEAVEYGKLSGDIPLHIYALKQEAWMHYYSQRSDQAVKAIGQATLVLKEHKNSLPQYAHSNIYSALAVMQARNNKDKDLSLRLWTQGINGARALHSEQRYREALLAYEIMQSLWPGEDDIKALRELAVHW